MQEFTEAISSIISDSLGGATVVFLENEVRDIEVGIHDYEFGIKQPVQFDIFAAQSGEKNDHSGNIESVLNYEYLISSLNSSISSRRFNLLENLADDIIGRVMLPEEVRAASVKITKLGIPEVKGGIGCSVTRIK
tara:strand:+ start:54 stop:458 length:405 start_codon:yes stop_codon:yes gene_type:complete